MKKTLPSSSCLVLLSALLTATGCSTIAGKTNMLSDDKIKSDTSGVLGYSQNDVTILSKRTEGTNTYVTIKANDGKEFACIINGGNLLTLGITNPPTCNKRG